MTLYEIDQAILDCVDMETGEVIDSDRLDLLQMERETKLENVGLWIKDLRAEADAIKNEIQKKDGSLVGNMASQGTTPRRLTDLIGSLCDLTSGSGDKGTPIVYIQGYFDNYTND